MALRVGVVGCGTAGPAAALHLRRAGHEVEVLEAAPRLGPVGAGILLQPTGLAALGRLGLLDAVLACGEPIARVDGRTVGGRKVLDLPYGELRPGLHGLGIHRGALFTVLHDALREAEVPVRLGVAARRLEPTPHGRLVRDSAGDGHGPFDLVVVADGARSTLRRHVIAGGSVRRYPWGALWAIVEDPHGRFGGVLRQVYRGTREMLGFLPLGRPRTVTGDDRALVSLFWSLRADRLDDWRSAGMLRWKDRVLALAPDAGPVLEQISDDRELLFTVYHDVRLPRWHGEDAALVGDAAHAMSPQLGQGVNLALLDAQALARCVGDGRDMATALERYTRARRAHVRWYALVSRMLTPFFQSDLRALGPVRDALTAPTARVPPLRRLMLESLAGTRSGLRGAHKQRRSTTSK